MLNRDAFLNNTSGQPFVVKYNDFPTTKLVDASLAYHDSIDMNEAKRMAMEAGLDLVCFNRPDKNGGLALCKIIDFGKWKYSSEKKKKKQEKLNKKTTKEIRLSPVIGEHDIEHKLKHVREFIEDGNDVSFLMMLKGRQRAHFKDAEDRMNEIVAMCSEYSKEISRHKSSNTIEVRVSSNKKEKK